MCFMVIILFFNLLVITSCKNNEPSANPLDGTTWVGQEGGREYIFSFKVSNFTLIEAILYTGGGSGVVSTDKGTYTYNDNEGIITLTFESTDNPYVDLSVRPTTATVAGQRLIYRGLVYTKQ